MEEIGLSSTKIEKLNKSSDLNYHEVNESAENEIINTAEDPEQLKKSVTFNDETYQPTFQMQPEVVNVKAASQNKQQFVFGNAKITYENQIEDPVKSSDSKPLDSNDQMLSSINVADVSMELNTTYTINQDASVNEEIDIEIITDTNEAVDDKKICKCFSSNDEQDIQYDEPSYPNNTEMKTAKSVDFEVLEEEKVVPLKSYGSLISTTISDHNLRKVQNLNDLTKTDSSTHLKSQSFVDSQIIDGSMQNNIIQVSSVPSIITRQYHTEKNSKEALITKESMSVAKIEDYNDDGFIDLPKVPSNALSEASSSEWIDENTSFVNSHDEAVTVKPGPEIIIETVRLDELHVLPLESLCSVLNEPQLSNLAHSDPQPQLIVPDPPKSKSVTFDPQPSTSADSEPVQKQKRFSGCKNFVKRLISNTLHRKKR